MALLTNPAELEAPKAIAGMLYGQPGSWKSTTALSAPHPVLIDLDRGMHRVRPAHRVPSLQVDNYQQILDLLAGDELKPYETIVFDTAGKLIDRIGEYVMANNPKCRTGGGNLSQQGWGEVKGVFTSLRKRLALLNKSIIFVAHESEEKNGDDTIKRPDIAGSARKDIVKDLDFMGYMELRGDRPVISFNPTDKFYAKNSLGLDPSVEVPPITDDMPNNFLAKYVFKASEAKLAEQTQMRVKYEELLTDIIGKIYAVKTAADANAFYADLHKLPVLWDSLYYARNKLKEQVDSIGVVFDKAAKQFVAKNPADSSAPAAPVAAVQEKAGDVSTTTSPAEPAPAEEPKKEISDKDFSV